MRNCGITEIRLTGGQVALLEFNTPIDDPDAQETSVTRVLAAGDHFVLNDLLIDALRGEVARRSWRSPS